MLQEGMQAPAFSLPDDQGTLTSFPQALQAGGGVLYFYPKDDTPGCTQEALEFEELISDFSALDTSVFGLSACSQDSHTRFKCAYNLSFPLLSDEARTTIEAYGVWKERTLYGKKFWGIERTTFFLAPDLTVLKIWKKVSPKGHAKAVLEWVRKEKEK